MVDTGLTWLHKIGHHNIWNKKLRYREEHSASVVLSWYVYFMNSREKICRWLINHFYGKSPQYLADFCTPVSDLAARQRLRSPSRHQLVVPRFRRSTYGRRAFSVAGPSVWNSLPVEFRNPDISIGMQFQTVFKDMVACFLCTNAFSALEVFSPNALYKFTFYITFYITLHYVIGHESYRIRRNNAK